MNLRHAVSTFRGHRVPHFDIIGRRNIWFALSGFFILLSLVGLLVIGLKFSIDFTGGAVLTLDNKSGASISDYQDALSKFDGLQNSTIEIINGNQIQIRTKASLTSVVAPVTASPSATGTSASPSPSVSATASPSASPTASAAATAGPTPSTNGASPTASPPVLTTPSPVPTILEHHVGDDVRIAVAKVAGISPNEINEQDVGPTWGSQISGKAFQGLLLFLVLVSVYISLRFEPKMAGSALIALLHDLIITAGIYALVGREVTPAAVIAILTILGYSLYDTVVIFDKIKENTDNAALIARETYGGVVNMSLNQTLMRSVNTSLVVLLPIGSLLLFGGSTLKDFAFALFVGVASGTYSSIFVAAPTLVLFKEREPRYQALRAKATQRAARTATAQRPAKADASRSAGNGEATTKLRIAPGGGNGSPAPGDAGQTPAPASAAGAPTQQSARPSGAGGGSAARKKSSSKSKPKRRRR